MKVCIYGVGGVGGYLACRLHNAGMDVSMVSRGKMLEAIQSKGLKLESPQGDVWMNAASAKVTNDPATIGPVDLVILCVKAWEVESVAHSLAPMLKPDSIILPIQNGVESHEVVEGVVGGGRTLMGFALIFAYIKSPGVVAQDQQVKFCYGEYQSDRTDRVARLNSALCDVPGVDFISPPNIEGEVWKKFILISPMSGMCAITRAPIRTWVEIKEIVAMHQKCIKEVIAVAAKKGVCLPNDTADSAANAPLKVKSLSMTTSMARDMLQGKPSEMEDLIGAVVRLGQEGGIPTPTFDTIHAALLPQERKARGIVEYFNEGIE